MLSPENLHFAFDAGDERLRLDQFVCLHLPKVSQTRVRNLIVEGAILVNGERSLKGYRLCSGDRVTVRIHAADKSSATPEAIPLSILFEDAHLIVVNKPRGLLVHPSHREKSGTLTNALAYHFWQTEGGAIRPGLVHRLDRQTSGAIIVAKTARAHRTLSKHFHERWVKKIYLALVTGRVEGESGEIDAPIGAAEGVWPRWRILPDGKPARTLYRVRRRFPSHTLLELEPLTGRTHQIRLHCAALGHPLTGDPIYGGPLDPMAKRLGLDYHLLHASQLLLRHPATSEQMQFVAPPPTEMEKAIELLAKITE